jgi:hypothetical protein
MQDSAYQKHKIAHDLLMTETELLANAFATRSSAPKLQRESGVANLVIDFDVDSTA